MHIKKILSVSVLFISLSSAASAAETGPLTGLYVGAYGGYDWTEVKTGIGLTPELSGKEYGVFVGYRLDALLKKAGGFGIGLTAAVEGSFGNSNATASDQFLGIDNKTEKQREWGVSVRPGLEYLTDLAKPLGVNPYAIVGYRKAEYRVSNTFGTAKFRNDGYDLGVGAEMIAFGNYGIRADYTHTWFDETTSITPESDNVRIGLSYHF